MGKQDYIFLLGGYDLEMVTIRNLLIEHGYIDNISLFDKHLSWGAKWSDYSDVYSRFADTEKIIFGVELLPDIKLPSNCQQVDHHYPTNSEPTSIEQIAKLLDINMTRRNKLVAVNDVAHINGLRLFGASDMEIAEIRQLDRLAQGVSMKEELQAVIDCEHKLVLNGIEVVETTITHFSAITDRLQCEKLFIFNDTKFCYYGTNALKLGENLFYNELKENTMYCGGGENGFLGSASGAYSKTDIKEIFLNKICESFYE